MVLVDEVAFLTAYQPDRKLRERIMAALATLTTQGRAVGYCVVAALQDPRKEVLAIRNLFPDRIARRLDEPGQTDMMLGDGAHDRGAACELISTDPAIGAGVAFIRLEADPDPVRVRAGWVSDADIWAMAAEDAELRPKRGPRERGDGVADRRAVPGLRHRPVRPGRRPGHGRRVPPVRLRRHWTGDEEGGDQ